MEGIPFESLVSGKFRNLYILQVNLPTVKPGVKHVHEGLAPSVLPGPLDSNAVVLLSCFEQGSWILAVYDCGELLQAFKIYPSMTWSLSLNPLSPDSSGSGH